MAINPSEIRRGMDVFAIDGEKIGTVTGVESPEADETDPLAALGGSLDDAGSIPTDTAGGQAAAAGGSGFGPLPQGATRDKGRGAPTAAGAATERGDMHTTGGEGGITPGAGGLDAVRGYGTPQDLIGNPPIGGGGATTTVQTQGSPGEGSGTGAAPGAGGGTATGGGPTLARPGLILVQDDGALGVDARGLRVPLSGVLDVVPGERIVLDCTRDQAAMRYGSGPSLDIDENADVTPF